MTSALPFTLTMIITDITDQFTPDRITGPADDGTLPPRSTGLHISQIYQDIEMTLDPAMGLMSDEELNWYRNGGWLWERIYARVMADSFTRGDIIRPGEVYKDGIIGSPDNVDLQNWRVIETKCTWKSMNKFESLEKWFWPWLVQMKGYCHLIDATEAELYVIFVNGNYRGSGPQPRAIRLKFAPIEIEENWAMLKRHARTRGWM